MSHRHREIQSRRGLGLPAPWLLLSTSSILHKRGGCAWAHRADSWHEQSAEQKKKSQQLSLSWRSVLSVWVRQREMSCFRKHRSAKLRTLFLCKNLHKFIELIQTNYLFGLNSTTKSASKPKANCGSGKYIPCERNQNKKRDGLTVLPFSLKLHMDASLIGSKNRPSCLNYIWSFQ